MYTVFVRILVKPEYLDPFLQATEANHRATRQEAGNLRFDVLRSADDPNRFFLYEVYENEAAFKAHQQTDHYFAWKDTVARWMAEPRCADKARSVWPDPWH